MTTLRMNGAVVHKGYLDRAAQEAMAADVAGISDAAPFYRPMTPWGKPMRVEMTSAGDLGWFTDRRGYRYVETHPDGQAWPPVPAGILDVWSDLVSKERLPDCCLVNRYGADAKMGLHQDKDEADFSWPVLSISLGDTGVFRVGGLERSDPTESIALESGDVVILGGDARLAFHGIDRIKAGSSTLFSEGGRVNLTLRVVS